ncbi:response regulator [Massilia cavernae]|uniref:response regulator n=1 Tax=Massilia cavernae TaxID=2320864 RepID=UPI0016018910|nr:response regulator transcription factor [Massilia cavernae]
MTRIVIADDHALIREGVKKIIRSSKDLRIVGEAAGFEQLVELVPAAAPDLVILDLSLPGYEGLAGLVELKKNFPALRVLILSMFPEEQYAVAALRGGAAGYVTKAMAAEELILAIRRVMGGGSYISEHLAGLLVMDAVNPQQQAVHEALTKRELDVLRVIGSGRQVKQVSAELGISVSSVNTYRARIFRKMGLASNAALIRYALKYGLVA